MIIVALILVVAVMLFLFYASYSIKSGVYIKALCSRKTEDKVIALTFDDGPDAERTPKVLDILKTYNAKACFFCIGSKIEGNEALLKRIIDEGHLIANHSFSHLFSFPLHSYKWVRSDLGACESKIQEVTNEKVYLFRPPFGVTNPLIAKAAKAMGYTTIGWSIRSLDTCRKMDKVLGRIKKQLKPGAVLLLHDSLPDSDMLLLETLKYLSESNYKIERVDVLFDLNNIK